MIYTIMEKTPTIDPSVFIAENAAVGGDVLLSQGVSVWYGASIRGDIDTIQIGEGSNIQDNASVHTDKGIATTIGRGGTVGHNAVVHGCTIEDDCLIGMGAIILNGAVIGKGSIVGAGALVTEGKVFPPGSLILGSPAVLKKEVGVGVQEKIKENALHYQKLAQRHRQAQEN